MMDFYSKVFFNLTKSLHKVEFFLIDFSIIWITYIQILESEFPTVWSGRKNSRKNVGKGWIFLKIIIGLKPLKQDAEYSSKTPLLTIQASSNFSLQYNRHRASWRGDKNAEQLYPGVFYCSKKLHQMTQAL